MLNSYTFVRTASNSYRWLLDLFLPPQCVVCGKVETWLCAICAQQFTLYEGECCPRCGRPLERAETLCVRCQSNPLKVAPIRSAFTFQGTIRDAMYALKYRGGREIVGRLAPHMQRAWENTAMQSDVLVPVPLHPEREARRGYNQSALLAIALGQRLGIPVAVNALSRVRNTQSQTQLGFKARQTNVMGAFAATDAANLSGKWVTLIDDVATTGATLNACAEALLAHGVSQVNAFTLVHAL